MGFFNSLTSHFHAFVLALLMFTQFLVGAVNYHASVVVIPPSFLQNIATSSLYSALLSTKAASSSTPAKPVPKTTAVVSSTKIVIPVVAPTPITAPAAPVSLIPTEQLNAQTRPALVNILCTTKAGGSFSPISGSGVIIDTRGVILTNAHVGQFFLLTNYGSVGNVQCIVRTGSPATPSYTATLLYLPPPWVVANASQITSTDAMGTGENDYSFLLITGPVTQTTPYPTSFPALNMSINAPDVGTNVFLAAYPAQLLGGIAIQENLYASSAMSTVQTLYAFEDPTNVDLVALAGTIVAQTGSSGGAVVNATNGNLVGLITTESQGTTTSSRLLNAITLAHINRSLTALGQSGIAGILNTNLQQEAADFQTNIEPSETQQLEAVLNKESN